MPVVRADGRVNLPDGEVFTAPVRDSVNGYITFNCPSYYKSIRFEKIHFGVENGRIVKARASAGQELDRILDTDDGARYFGEYAFGLNPAIHRPSGDIMFDEKIAGSIHLAAGNSYPEADNGNHSAVHWDIVLMMDRASGGGEIYLDDQLLMRDSLFVDSDLLPLNKRDHSIT